MQSFLSTFRKEWIMLWRNLGAAADALKSRSSSLRVTANLSVLCNGLLHMVSSSYKEVVLVADCCVIDINGYYHIRNSVEGFV